MYTVIKLHIRTKALLTHSLFISFFFHFLGGKKARYKSQRSFWSSVQNMLCLPPHSSPKHTHIFYLSVPPSLSLSLPTLPSLFLSIPLSHIFICTSLFHQNEHMTDLNLKQSYHLAPWTCLYLLSSVHKENVDPLWDEGETSKIKGTFSFDVNICRMMKYLTIPFSDDLLHKH